MGWDWFFLSFVSCFLNYDDGSCYDDAYMYVALRDIQIDVCWTLIHLNIFFFLGLSICRCVFLGQVINWLKWVSADVRSDRTNEKGENVSFSIKDLVWWSACQGVKDLYVSLLFTALWRQLSHHGIGRSWRSWELYRLIGPRSDLS